MVVVLEDVGIRWSTGYDAWGRDGRYRFHTPYRNRIFWWRAAWFRDCSSGKVYQIFSSYKTREVKVRFMPLEAQVVGF